MLYRTHKEADALHCELKCLSARLAQHHQIQICEHAVNPIYKLDSGHDQCKRAEGVFTQSAATQWLQADLWLLYNPAMSSQGCKFQLSMQIGIVDHPGGLGWLGRVPR